MNLKLLNKIEQLKKIKILPVVFIVSSISLFAQTNNFPVNGDALLNTTINETPGAITNSSSIIFRSSGYAIDGRSRFQHWKMQGVGRSSWGSGDLAFYSNTDGAGYKEIFRLSNSGNVGIGTTTPNATLQIGDSDNSGSPENEMEIKRLSIAPVTHSGSDWFFTVRDNKPFANLDIGYFDKRSLTLRHDGNIGIGADNPDSKLTVKGNIHAQEVKVDLAGSVAPDYVFKEGYDLRTLEEVEAHIHKEGHLPNIPSAEEMGEDGINLKEMNLKLLEKIEELTLYVIGQQKSMKLQEEKFNNQIHELKIELNNLKGR